jgi:DNA-binding response OmpR family regulator
MSTILLVDADPLSLRVLDVSLRGAGFAVTTARESADALAKAGVAMPDLVITDTRLHDGDGFALVSALRQHAGAEDLPAIFLSSRESTEEERERGRELGVDEILVKPAFVRELLARVHLLLARRVQRVVATGPSPASDEGRLVGTTEDLALVDLLQSLEASRASGVVHLSHEGQEARIYLRDGNVVDAELGRLRGAEVVHRTLTWDPASFRVEPGPVDNDDLLECTTHALLLRAMDRLDGLTPAPEPVEPALDTQPGAVSREQSLPSTAPWTREAESSAPPAAETDLVAAGVPLARGRTFRQVGLVAAAVGAVGLLTVALASQHSRHAHEDPMASAGTPTLAAAAAVVSQPVQPDLPAAPVEKETPAATVSDSPAAPAATEVVPVPGLDVVAAAAAPGGTPAAAPAVPAKDPRETALDVRAELHSRSPLVREAHRALLKGDTGRALSLAQQAVAANSADADAWLTLAAARKASGDVAGARDAYAKCVADGRTFGVMSCRALGTRTE